MTIEPLLKFNSALGNSLCHPSTIYRLVNTGGMPGFRLRGGWRFKRSLIDEWIRKADRRSLRKESLRDTKE